LTALVIESGNCYDGKHTFCTFGCQKVKFECILLFVNFVSGYGVFALKSFSAGDFLLGYHGELIDPVLGSQLQDQTYIANPEDEIVCERQPATHVVGAAIILVNPTENSLFGATIRDISYRSRIIANFLLKSQNFHYRGNSSWSETNFTYTVKFADPENPLPYRTVITPYLS